MTNDELTAMADRLEAYNAWRRGHPTTDGYDPEPLRIGLDIEAAIWVIRLAAAPDDHLYEGDCPDPLQPDAMDPNCQACLRMGPAA
jgi:hypothetical protein